MTDTDNSITIEELQEKAEDEEWKKFTQPKA